MDSDQSRWSASARVAPPIAALAARGLPLRNPDVDEGRGTVDLFDLAVRHVPEVAVRVLDRGRSQRDVLDDALGLAEVDLVADAELILREAVDVRRGSGRKLLEEARESRGSPGLELTRSGTVSRSR